jgi:PPM family protein phosphatase
VTTQGEVRDAAQTVLIGPGVRTDVGLKRKANEDSYLAGYPVFVVADGMGGHDAGDRASQAVVHQLSALVGLDHVGPEELAEVLERAQAAVGLIADETERGAGSTLTGVIITSQGGIPHWLVFNVGDSRVYRLREGELAQLTVDHSVMQQLLDAGELDPSEIDSYPGKNVITRAMGADDSDADYWLHPIVQNERLVLCSDGLSGEVTDAVIRTTLLSTPGAQEAADALVALALENGGRDNVTVIVLDVLAGGLDPLVDDLTVLTTPVAPPELVEDTLEIPDRKGHRGTL